MKQWMMTYTGLILDPMDPKPDVIAITDIAHHLALVNRYGGATKEPYSVAEHCVHVSRHVPAWCALEGLLHDAGEYIMGDIIRPIKKVYAELNALESAWMGAVYEAFGVVSSARSRRFVKDIDSRIICDETRSLMERPKDYSERTPLGIDIGPMSWQEAKRAFLQRFKELT